jgi:glycosyltransferase involved in cell wall biosynthesis
VPATGIVHQLDPWHPVAGGIETCIAGVLRYAPVDETLILIGADRSGTRQLPLGKLRWFERDGRKIGFLPVARLAPGGRSGLMPETVHLVVGLLRFRRRIRDLCDELQVHRSETGAVLGATLRAVPRVQCIHGDSARALRHRSVSYWRFFRSLHLAVERWSVRRARRTFVFSKSGAARLGRVSSAVDYLPTWYDPALVIVRTEPREASGARALWVGRLEEEKDPVLALEALEAFLAGSEGREATIVGDGTLMATLRSTRHPALGVSLPGALPAEAVARTMADADALLMTSRFEGSPVVMNEALAAGTPVVCTPESDPDHRIVDGRNGIRVDGRAPGPLAEALAAAPGLTRADCVASVEDLAAPMLVPRLFEG